MKLIDESNRGMLIKLVGVSILIGIGLSVAFKQTQYYNLYYGEKDPMTLEMYNNTQSKEYILLETKYNFQAGVIGSLATLALGYCF